MSEKQPVAFMSYVRDDDQHEAGRLSEFRERLSGEVKMQTGFDFEIFQDRNGIKWGDQWKARIVGALEEATFLIPILTPRFFRSEACREELEVFIEFEKKRGRDDLVLPVYYVSCRELDEPTMAERDVLAKTLTSRQYADWRDLRFEPLTNPTIRKSLADLATQIRKAIERTGGIPEPKKAPPKKPVPVISKAAEATGKETEGLSAFEGRSELPDRRPAEKTEPQILVVDTNQPDGFTTITKAIKAAAPGDRIMVRPGLYQEGLIIDKPLEIIGDGECSEIKIQAENMNVILFKTTMGRVANLTLKQVGGGKFYCVDIGQGRLELEDCDITSQSLSCITVHHGADPRIRRNRIHDGKQGGVFIYENSQGTIEDNEIFGNAFSGIEIKKGGNPMIRRNRIYDGGQDGIWVHENGKGMIEDNEIFANAMAGVEVREGDNPVVRRNRISRNATVGISIIKKGGGEFTDNDLRENAGGAWRIDAESMPLVKRSNNREK